MDAPTENKAQDRARTMNRLYGKTEAENQALDRARLNGRSDRDYWMRVYEILSDGWCAECGEPWPCSDFRRTDLPPLATANHRCIS